VTTPDSARSLRPFRRQRRAAELRQQRGAIQKVGLALGIAQLGADRDATIQKVLLAMAPLLP
jgi:hypothetical protein